MMYCMHGGSPRSNRIQYNEFLYQRQYRHDIQRKKQTLKIYLKEYNNDKKYIYI